MEVNNRKKLWTLFITTASISATTNGGWAIVAAMKDKFANKNHWIEEEEMMDLMSIAQSCPGPIAINTSVLVGYRIAGVAGGLLTLFGTVLPPLVMMSIVTIFYDFIAGNKYVEFFMKGMQAGVAALLVSITIDLFMNIAKKKDIFFYILMALAFIYNYFFDFSVLYLAIFCAVMGIIKTLMLVKKVEEKK